ncbi:Lipid phosphate phosphatase epsilon 2, chloroplastic [Vitis vinifera]|uniref:Lipid phosphate phosphatase epsilon 2, chloroplastic n=1 Tax=Vitis vinifera TaxID=29760 RepID=A0A438K5P5_VITVI|nr:Lipid phosphate phosphatase epsilon 2, chloroplastic [Vitis vinifera]
MSGATSLLHRSPFPFSPKPHRSLKPISIPAFSTSNLAFSGGFSSDKFLFRKNRVGGPLTMTELVRTSAFRNGNDDEGATMTEEEAFITGSSEFPADIVAGGLEATLNRLHVFHYDANVFTDLVHRASGSLLLFFGIVILWRHDAESLWAAMGSVLNTVLSVTLKQILNQERPVSALRSGPGMPSSHAQSIFFTVVFTILSVVEWLGINGLTLTISGLALALGSYLSWLRVSQQFHTISQVLVGSAVGSVFCILWLWSWEAFVLNAYTSYLWVRVLVIVGAVGFCLGFVLHVIKHWLLEE